MGDKKKWQKRKSNREVNQSLRKKEYAEIGSSRTHAKVALKDKTMSVEIMAVESKAKNDTGDAPHVNIKTNETGGAHVCCSGQLIQNNAPWFQYCGRGYQTFNKHASCSQNSSSAKYGMLLSTLDITTPCVPEKKKNNQDRSTTPSTRMAVLSVVTYNRSVSCWRSSVA